MEGKLVALSKVTFMSPEQTLPLDHNIVLAATPPDEGASVFTKRSLQAIYEEIRQTYEQFPNPWVVGYSGGKDSTAVLQLIWNALSVLPVERRRKPVFVVASDTKVETPVIVDFIDSTLRLINERATAEGMPFVAHKVMPTLSDSFWVNLIGRGYPAPTTRFRWCTDRMKILPANRFISERVAEFGEVIVVLGVRKAESSTREQLMQTYEVHDHILRRHSSLLGAYVYAPIADFLTQDVWDFLLNNPSPWGGRNRDLVTLYRNASSGECPLVIDSSTPSCGNSRFGCWVCTVAQRDSSMEALVENGEEWLEPLLEFRNYLATTVDPSRKHEFRDIKGRDGRVLSMKDGSFAARTYKLETSKHMLEQLLRTEVSVQTAQGGDPTLRLISDDELYEIRRIWRMERQDWDDSVPLIVKGVGGRELPIEADDDGAFDGRQKQLLQLKCDEFGVPFDLLAKLLEMERQTAGMARRAGVPQRIASIFAQEWRSETELREYRDAEGETDERSKTIGFQLSLRMAE